MSDLPRLAHVQSHLPQRVRPLLADLLRAETNVQLADRLGLSRRQLEYAGEPLRDLFLPESMSVMGPSAIYARMAALRVAAGIDPCWCESSTEYPQRTAVTGANGLRLVDRSPISSEHASDNGGSPARHPTTAGGVTMTLRAVSR